MCVGFWSITHPMYALILCANRDEYLARPTLPAHFHSFEAVHKSALNDDGGPAALGGGDRDRGRVLSGRDELAGGTWLGVSRPTGRVALLTNITEPGAVYDSSRGTLMASFLSDPRDDSNLLDSTTRALTDENTPSYAGFNLLLFEPMKPQPQPQPQPQSSLASNNKLLTYDVRLITNDGGGGRIRSRSLTDSECACGGISNGVDGQGGEDWPKVVQGRAGLQSVLDGLSPETEEESHLAGRLIELLTTTLSTVSPPRERTELKNTIFVPPFESSSGVSHGIYGTRLAQVILVRRDGLVTYVERDVWVLDNKGVPVQSSAVDNMRSFTFTVGTHSSES
ncbi:NRDE protein-domain-containing protein [Lactifluus volemus]|nr:NRDE protein-domain-containing protein [Lactifluus volemus]